MEVAGEEKACSSFSPRKGRPGTASAFSCAGGKTGQLTGQRALGGPPGRRLEAPDWVEWAANETSGASLAPVGGRCRRLRTCEGQAAEHFGVVGGNGGGRAEKKTVADDEPSRRRRTPAQAAERARTASKRLGRPGQRRKGKPRRLIPAVAVSRCYLSAVSAAGCQLVPPPTLPAARDPRQTGGEPTEADVWPAPD